MPEQTNPKPADSAPQPDRKERRFVQLSVDALIRWMPLGGSGWLFATFLLRQEWLQVLLTFPVTVVTAIWAAYSENFIARLREIYAERGKQDADALVSTLKSLDEALRWQLANPEAKYLKCQAGECLYNEVEGYKSPSDIMVPLLEEVFVPLELSGSFSMNPEGDVIPIQMGAQHPDRDELLAKQLEQGSLTIWDLLSRTPKDSAYRRMAILAWGGFGKTTLLRHITYTYTRPYAQRYKAPKLVPILLYFRKWRDLLAQEDAPSLPDLITKHHIPGLPEGKRLSLPPNWAEHLLRRGDALVMLDGFDEVADNQRQTVSQWISEQLREYPRSTFILTSRPGGYKDYAGAETFRRTVFVKPFSEKQWRAFIEKWYVCQERHSRSDSDRNLAVVKAIAAQKAEELAQQINQRSELADMATNPLLLNMIATFHRFYPGSELPKRRTELYQAICQLQLGARPEYKRIKMLLSAEESQKVLQHVALEMLKRDQPRIPLASLIELIQAALNTLNATATPREFLEQIVKVSELLVEREPDEYDFAHLSFRNYLAAVQVKHPHREVLLLKNWNKPSWKETILLYVAQVDPTTLLQGLLAQGAGDLAYECLRELTRKIDSGLEAEVRNLRYQRLENHLKNGQWQEADKETYRLMITTVGKEAGQWFDQEDLLSFPCEDLRALDYLWVKYSNGKFGFSVQKQIYLECGGLPDGNYPEAKIWDEFCERIQWVVNGKHLSFSNDLLNGKALSGYLPLLGIWLGAVDRDHLPPGVVVDDDFLGDVITISTVGCALFPRIETCRV